MKKYRFVPFLILVGVIFLGFFVSFDSQKVYASENFLPLGQTPRYWNGLSIDSSNHDVYATTYWSDDIYKQTGGTGNFVALGQTIRSWNGISVDSSNHDVYATVPGIGGDIYKQTGGVGDFVALGQTARSWIGISVDSSNHDVYATVSSGDIYKQTGGTGNFVALGQTIRSWYNIAVDSSNHNVYATVSSGDIYKQTGGTGNFVALGQTIRSWYGGITVDSSNHNVYAIDPNTSNGIYKQTGGTGDFVFLPIGVAGVWFGIAVDSLNHDVYAGIFNGDIYKMTSINGTLTPASPSCFIASGASSCDINFSWTTTNPVGVSAITSSYPVANTTVTTGNLGTDIPLAIPYLSSPRDFYLYNNTVLLAQSTVTSSCIGGTNWNGSICAPIMSGTLTATNCTITSGTASCNTSLNWSTTNPVVTSAVTSSYPVANTSVATGNSGNNVSVAVPYLSSPRKFYLYNNGVELSLPGGVSATASCGGTDVWNGSICAPSGGGPAPVCDAATWYNVGGTWTNRKVIAIDHTKVPSSQTDFPVLISLSGGDYPSGAQGDGDDILFTSSNGTTKLAHEIEKIGSGQLVAWVKMDVSFSADTKIYMYYGNADASNQQNATGVWNSNYKGVWHMPNGSTLTANDSTGNINNGTVNGATPTSAVVDGGANFSGANKNINTGTSASLYITAQPITLSAWIKPTSFGGGSKGRIMEKADPITTDQGYVLDINNIGVTSGMEFGSNGATAAVFSDNNAISTGVWQYVTVTYTSNVVTFYVNGVTKGAPAYSTAFGDGSAGNFLIGDRSTGNRTFDGTIDEVRVSNSARSADWIKTEYNNQSNPSTFYGVSAQCNLAVSAITADNQSGSVDIPYGGSAELRWSYANATFCSITPPPNIPIESYPNGSGGPTPTGALYATRPYMISCDPGGINSTVTVNVPPQPESLIIMKSGQGIVTSSPAGISCGQECQSQTVNFPSGSTVIFHALLVAPNRIFTGWTIIGGGSCLVQGSDCSLVVDGPKTVIANFAVNPNYKEF